MRVLWETRARTCDVASIVTTCVFIVAALVMLGTAHGGLAAPVDEAAKTIGDELLASAFSNQQRLEGRIVARPFAADGIYVPVDEADRLSNAVLARIVERSGGRLALVDNRDIALRIEELQETLSTNRFQQEVKRLLAQIAADLEVVGTIDGAGISATAKYRIVSRSTFQNVAFSSSHAVVLSTAPQVLSLDAALAKAARQLSSVLPPIDTVYDGGLQFQQSGVRTSAGRLLSKRLLDRLATEQQSAIHNHAMAVHPVDLGGAERWGAGAGDVSPPRQSKDEYLLRGEYWPKGSAIDVTFELRDASGKVVYWYGTISRDSFPHDVSFESPPPIDILAVNILDLTKGAKRMLLVPMPLDELPISRDAALHFVDDVVDAVLRATQASGAGVGQEVVAVNELRALSKNEAGISPADVEELIRSSSADWKLTGTMRSAPGGIVVSYRAERLSDGHLSSTPEVFFPMNLESALKIAEAASIEAAVKKVATFVRDKFPEVNTIYLNGLFYGDTDIQTPFSLKFMDTLEAQFGEMNKKVALISRYFEQIRARGRVIPSQAPVNSQRLAERKSQFVIQGRYHLLDNNIIIKFTVDRHDGDVSKVFDVMLSRQGVPSNFYLEPDTAVTRFIRTNAAGPLGLYLSSTSGPNPVYRIGEKMVLQIETRENAYVYCFYRSADGSVVKIFPNQYHENERLTGGMLHNVPDETMGFDLTMGAPASTDLVKCFALNRSVNEYLPSNITSNSFDPIKMPSESWLTDIFRKIDNVRIGEATLVVTVRR